MGILSDFMPLELMAAAVWRRKMVVWREKKTTLLGVQGCLKKTKKDYLSRSSHFAAINRKIESNSVGI